MQTDPIGYGDGMNLYAYVRGDTINLRDPTGTIGSCFNVQVWQISIDGGKTWEDDPNDDETREVCLGGSFGLAAVRSFGGGGGGGDKKGRYKYSLDPCKGKGTNEGTANSGHTPYNVDVWGSLAQITGHVFPRHAAGTKSMASEFSANFSSSSYLLSIIGTVIQTNPAPSFGGRLVYTVNTGQYAGFDRINGGQTYYITVVMGPSVKGTRRLITAYPGCPK